MYNFNKNKANANYVIVLGGEEQDSCNNPFFITVWLDPLSFSDTTMIFIRPIFIIFLKGL